MLVVVAVVVKMMMKKQMKMKMKMKKKKMMMMMMMTMTMIMVMVMVMVVVAVVVVVVMIHDDSRMHPRPGQQQLLLHNASSPRSSQSCRLLESSGRQNSVSGFASQAFTMFQIHITMSSTGQSALRWTAARFLL